MLKDVSKAYVRKDKRLEVLRPTSFTVLAGEFFVVFGPSGCGKTTLLRVIAGLEKPSSGTLLLDDSPIQGPSRERGMVFQGFTSFPWLVVSQNIAYGLRLHRSTYAEARGVVDHWIKETGLKGDWLRCHSAACQSHVRPVYGTRHTELRPPGLLPSSSWTAG